MFIEANDRLELRLIDAFLRPNHTQTLVFLFVLRNGLLDRCMMLLVT